MRPAVNRFLLWTLASTLLSLPAGAAGEETAGSGQEGADRFVASFAFLSGTRIQEWQAAGETRICENCDPSDPMFGEAQPPFADNDLDVTPYVMGSLELMTPELPLPGSPRLFFAGELGGAFGVERKVGRSGDPSVPSTPVEPGTVVNYFEGDALGQGSELVATYRGLVYAAHAGIALPFEMLGRQFRLRPSFGWTRFEVDLEGRVSDAECFENPDRFGSSGCNEDVDSAFFLRPGVIAARRTESFDGIGPGIELEMETGRLGPFGTSLLLGARAYRVLGDTKVAFDLSASFDDRATLGDDPDGVGAGGLQDEYDGTFGFEVDPWFYQMTVGFRFYWLGMTR